jgi:hypothetical protein
MERAEFLLLLQFAHEHITMQKDRQEKQTVGEIARRWSAPHGKKQFQQTMDILNAAVLKLCRVTYGGWLIVKIYNQLKIKPKMFEQVDGHTLWEYLEQMEREEEEEHRKQTKRGNRK